MNMSSSVFIILLLVVVILEVKQALFDTNVTACTKLCDSGVIDSITPLSLEKDDKNYVLIVRGLCSWNLDLKNPSSVSQYGHRHRFKYRKVEAIFTIFDDIKVSSNYNMTALFTGGITGETFKSEGKDAKKVWEGAVPLPGLGHKALSPITAVFEWQNDAEKQIKIIQGPEYYTYDMKAMKQVSGPHDLSKDYSLDPTIVGEIRAAFSQKRKVYFFTSEDFYVWTETTKTTEPKQSTKDVFFMCGGKPTAGPTGATGGTNGSIGSGDESAAVGTGGNDGSNGEDNKKPNQENSNPDPNPEKVKGGVKKVLLSIELLATILTFIILKILI